MHVDQFQMFYDEETMTCPVGVAYIAPSVTTYINLKPGYRVYYVDGDYSGSSHLVLDYDTFILNLTLANGYADGQAGLSKPQPDPVWSLLYRASTAYGMPTLFPSNWDALIKNFITDDRVFHQFWYLMHKGHVSEPCKDTCKTSLICFLRSGRYDLLERMARSVRKTLC